MIVFLSKKRSSQEIRYIDKVIKGNNYIDVCKTNKNNSLFNLFRKLDA